MVKCDVMPERQLGKTDHYPVVTILELTQERMTMQPSQNFRETDWDSFNSFLGKELVVIPIPSKIRTDADLGREIKQLTAIIQKAIKHEVMGASQEFPC